MATNLWRRFGELIKPPPEEVATVTQLNGDGTINATTLGGGSVRLRSNIDLAIGERVFFTAGEVRAKAPSLPYHELEV